MAIASLLSTGGLEVLPGFIWGTGLEACGKNVESIAGTGLHMPAAPRFSHNQLSPRGTTWTSEASIPKPRTITLNRVWDLLLVEGLLSP